jgi:carotenoid cleavage dioxygenase-like enzyme
VARFRQGFLTQKNEIQLESLPVKGVLPSWLTGTLVRVTPAQFEVNGARYRHWFDGLAMLHAFTFAGGRVSYVNRFLQTPAYRENNAEHRIKYGEFATDPCRSLFRRVVSLFTAPKFGVNANVTVSRLADDYVARTEIPLAVKFDAKTLETVGIHEHQEAKGQITTAHPHYDVGRDVVYNYRLELGRRNLYRIYAMPNGRNPGQIAEMPVAKPAYMHSFGMSDRYLILTEYPLKLPTSLALLLRNKPFIENYKWLPEEGTRFTIFDKNTGAVVAQSEAEPFFAFHHINAFAHNGELIVDLAAYENAGIIEQLYLENLTRDAASVRVDSQVRRYRVPLANPGTPRFETVSEIGFELPRYDYPRYAGKPYRIVFGVGTRPDTNDFINQLVQLDLESGKARTWYQDDMYPGEPVFVPKPDRFGANDGLILSVVLDAKQGRSFLLLLDAQSFEEQARAEVPQHIPFGFHGEFFGEVT